MSNDKYLNPTGLATLRDWVKGIASKVSFSRTLTSGTKVGTITIDGVNYDIYAPSGGGGGSSYATALPMGSDATDYPAKQLADTALTKITYDLSGADAINALADLGNENRGLLENSIHYRAKQVLSSSITIAARSASSNLTIAPDTISGFTPIFVSPRNTGHQSLHFRYCYLSTNNSYNDTINFTLGNPSASSVSVSNAWVNVLYVRNEMVRS